MRFTTFRGEKDIGALVNRLFNINGPDSAERAEKARTALLEANPQLRTISSLRRGSVLVVPEIPGVPLAAQAPVGPVIGAAVFDELRRALGDTRKGLESSIDREAQDLQDSLAAAEDAELRRSAEQFPELASHLEQIREQTKKDLGDIDDARRSLKDTFGVFANELEDLAKRVT